MTPNIDAATNKRETKRGASKPIRYMHAAAQPNWAISDCEEKRDSDERQRSQKDGHDNDDLDMTQTPG